MEKYKHKYEEQKTTFHCAPHTFYHRRPTVTMYVSINYDNR